MIYELKIFLSNNYSSYRVIKGSHGALLIAKIADFDLTSDLNWREEPRNYERTSAIDDIFPPIALH